MSLPPELEGAIARYNTWTDGELRKEQDANKISGTLYHYTNVAGLQGILKSVAVWFTDFRHVNDPSEISHGTELCRDIIRQRKPGTDGRVALFLDCLALRLENFSKGLEYFIGSFSRVSDDLTSGEHMLITEGVSQSVSRFIFLISKTLQTRSRTRARSLVQWSMALKRPAAGMMRLLSRRQEAF
jgi:hypothetical protein